MQKRKQAASTPPQRLPSLMTALVALSVIGALGCSRPDDSMHVRSSGGKSHTEDVHSSAQLSASVNVPSVNRNAPLVNAKANEWIGKNVAQMEQEFGDSGQVQPMTPEERMACPQQPCQIIRYIDNGSEIDVIYAGGLVTKVLVTDVTAGGGGIVQTFGGQ